MHFVLAFFSVLALAQDWQSVTELPALDTSGLSAAQKASLLKLLRTEGCSCPCGLKVAECRVKDPGCGDSRILASMAAQEMKAGKTPPQILASLRNSEMAKARRAALLGDPVALKIDGAPSRGPAKARVTLVEFSDFQCPFCRVAATRVYQVLAMYPNDVRLVFKQFPLDSHSAAALAAEASLAAHAQGKFWPLHDKMFSNAKTISEANLIAWAKELGLDAERFTADLRSGKYKKQVEAETLEGVAAGVSGTPTFFVNNKVFRGQMDVEAIKPLIEEELKKAAK